MLIEEKKNGRADDLDARAFRKGAGAIEALIDSPIDLQVQHFEMPRARRAACGATGGQLVSERLGVTCPDCKRHVAKKGGRR